MKKLCNRCFVEKDINDFSKNSHCTKDGHLNQCKKCVIDMGSPKILKIKTKDETFRHIPKQMVVDGKDDNGVVKYKLIHEDSKHWKK